MKETKHTKLNTKESEKKKKNITGTSYTSQKKTIDLICYGLTHTH